ncbi:alpha/beta hydrolase [Streptomyces abyssalis]|uniref:Alpha/beta hydrolase n=1 Tax=Streptomyces abyssalis TaxID=933944 RepID=A0A1E7JQ48_9ACTN|nr:alpha/beta hydrolase [Streptomyces abyssalis]OEU90376.1 alpha/beta hydrolase [Streptomyces abyssalis]OEU95113.1 alpha/beta hydrolase [Streptomyces abyssalis]
MTHAVHHRTATVDGLDVFYREAGDPQAPVLVLLHGFPTSSHMFRELIPALSDRYRVIAPDHIGFGQSAMPGLEEYPYTFEALTRTTSGLLGHLGVDRFAMYVHDYGAPIGWRLALGDPQRIDAIITQNGNAYTEGFVRSFWDGLFAYVEDPGPETERPVRGVLTAEVTRWQYVNGVPDPSLVSPDNWVHDQALLDRPGNDEIQLKLFRDYPTNVDLYPAVQQYFRDSQVPLLAVWGRNDEIFGPEGARAFQRDLPGAEIHLIESGHFALESHLETITQHIRDFLGRGSLTRVAA